ncbi:hypothetical protein ACFRU3_35070 [Streptomyces sp. NPDC056910]|uniref:hypothetical protein n=1 Tax=Streptomyces sp. NPDC056910 TaxID=3345964 RepID=UPI00367B3391
MIFFALGAVVHVAGGVTDHWSWGRVLPAVFVLAQIALAVEVAPRTARTPSPRATPNTS